MTTFTIAQPFISKYGRAPKGVKCFAEFYQNGQKALKIVDLVTGEPLQRASVALVDVPQGKGEIFIKNYSENEGVYQQLVEHNIIYEAHKAIPTGFVSVYACMIKPDYLVYWLRQLEGESIPPNN